VHSHRPLIRLGIHIVRRQGQLIFSLLLPSNVIDAWALSKPALEKPISHKQSAYMGFHRSEIYRNSE
jgi:hypothetical protein